MSFATATDRARGGTAHSSLSRAPMPHGAVGEIGPREPLTQAGSE
jgi:hypothetical protein